MHFMISYDSIYSKDCCYALMARIYFEVSTDPQLKSQMKLSTSHTLLQKIKRKKSLLLFKGHGETIFVTSVAYHERKVRYLLIAFGNLAS